MIKIIEYQPEHQAYFEKLNRNWIEKYFEMERLDEWILRHPEEAIIKPGGAILIGLYDEVIAGTVALRKINETIFEFTKMAVNESYKRKGIAEALSYISLEKAKQLGGKTVILYTNKILQPAIHLYEKIGFKYLHDNNKEYKRADIKMTINL